MDPSPSPGQPRQPPVRRPARDRGVLRRGRPDPLQGSAEGRAPRHVGREAALPRRRVRLRPVRPGLRVDVREERADRRRVRRVDGHPVGGERRPAVVAHPLGRRARVPLAGLRRVPVAARPPVHHPVQHVHADREPRAVRRASTATTAMFQGASIPAPGGLPLGTELSLDDATASTSPPATPFHVTAHAPRRRRTARRKARSRCRSRPAGPPPATAANGLKAARRAPRPSPLRRPPAPRPVASAHRGDPDRRPGPPARPTSPSASLPPCSGTRAAAAAGRAVRAVGARHRRAAARRARQAGAVDRRRRDARGSRRPPQLERQRRSRAASR